ncbi:MAG: dTDP-4-dehydrorhamnose reductase [Candidatus Hydrogenedentes bacterium]|nr:dTDP-4-dehydrorhamnose reductase [Candidatus Hydrogenedentota bacterium]
MKVLVIGAEGQLGTELCGEFKGCELHRADLDGGYHRLDIASKKQVKSLITDIGPDLVVNAAAAHNVPQCEEEPERAFAVNATGTRNIAVACRETGARFMHVSTDYVFGDGGTRPYLESDLPAPLNVYAASKLAGEHLIAANMDNYIIVRTAAIYGMSECRAKGGKNFVGLMLSLAATRPEVRVVTDEFTTPTYTRPLAKQMRLLAEKAEPGLYHVTCNGSCSWFEFAQAIFEETGTDVKLVPTTASEFQSPVRRPSYSVLENRHAQDQGLDIMPHWREALVDYLKAAEAAVG